MLSMVFEKNLGSIQLQHQIMKAAHFYVVQKNTALTLPFQLMTMVVPISW